MSTVKKSDNQQDDHGVAVVPPSPKSQGPFPIVDDQSPLAMAVREIDDPLVIFFRRWWSQSLVVLGVALLAWWGVTVYQGAAASRAQSAADVYRSLRESYATVLDLQRQISTEKEDKKREELSSSLAQQEKKLEEIVKAFDDSDGTYREIAAIYRGILLAQKKNNEALDVLIKGEEPWEQVAPGTSKRFIAENRAYVRARVMLNSSDTVIQARAVFTALAEKGEYFAGPAVFALLHTASNDDERQAAEQAKQSLIARFPEQREIIEGR